jgi:hypothetical protein
LYEESFGEAPPEIWEYTGMYESLELPKAKLKIREFVLLGILAMALSFIPLYYLLKPLYIETGNPGFVIGYIIIAGLTFLLLELYNDKYLSAVVRKFKPHSFIHHLRGADLVYLKTRDVLHVIHDKINRLVEERKVITHPDLTIGPTDKLSPGIIEEFQVNECFKNLGPKIPYFTLQQHLVKNRSLIMLPIAWMH